MRNIYTLAFAFILIIGVTGCKKNKKKQSVEVTKYSAETLYDTSKKYLDFEIWDNAIESYKNLRNQYPFGRYAEQGTLELAYAYYRHFDSELAISTLERFIKNYPAHEHLDYAYYLKGLIYFDSDRGLFQRVHPDKSLDRNQENAKQAFVSFKTFVEKFPKSQYAPDAQQRLVYLRNRLAAFELHVAKYYLRRKAYVAAINRSKFVIESYQKTDAVADALSVMAEAYKQLGESALENSSRLVLQTNFPNHPYLTENKIDLGSKLLSLKDMWIFSKKKK